MSKRHNQDVLNQMAESKKTVQRGRKPPEGLKRQFLTHLDPDVIKAVKQAALDDDTTASKIIETAAKEFLKRRAVARTKGGD